MRFAYSGRRIRRLDLVRLKGHSPIARVGVPLSLRGVILIRARPTGPRRLSGGRSITEAVLNALRACMGFPRVWWRHVIGSRSRRLRAAKITWTARQMPVLLTKGHWTTLSRRWFRVERLLLPLAWRHAPAGFGWLRRSLMLSLTPGLNWLLKLRNLSLNLRRLSVVLLTEQMAVGVFLTRWRSRQLASTQALLLETAPR